MVDFNELLIMLWKVECLKFPVYCLCSSLVRVTHDYKEENYHTFLIGYMKQLKRSFIFSGIGRFHRPVTREGDLEIMFIAALFRVCNLCAKG